MPDPTSLVEPINSASEEDKNLVVAVSKTIRAIQEDLAKQGFQLAKSNGHWKVRKFD